MSKVKTCSYRPKANVLIRILFVSREWPLDDFFMFVSLQHNIDAEIMQVNVGRIYIIEQLNNGKELKLLCPRGN